MCKTSNVCCGKGVLGAFLFLSWYKKKRNEAPVFCVLLAWETWAINSSLELTSFVDQAQLQPSVGSVVCCSVAVIFLRSIAVVIHHFFFHVASATRCADHMHQVWRVFQFTITFLTEEELFFVLCSVYVHTHINWTGWPRPRLISTPTSTSSSCLCHCWLLDLDRLIPHLPTSSSCFGHCCRLRRLWVLKSCPSFCKWDHAR